MKKKATNATINVRGTEVAVVQREGQDYISLTDMLKAKDGDFELSEPDGLAFDAQVEPGAAVVRGVEDELAHWATPNFLRIS